MSIVISMPSFRRIRESNTITPLLFFSLKKSPINCLTPELRSCVKVEVDVLGSRP